MSHKKHHFKKRIETAKKQQSVEEDKIPYSPYNDTFLEFQQELDSRYDKHERLVKLSRDCTILSKRVIFTLHRVTGNEKSKDKIIADARDKISNQILGLLQSIAQEITGEDPKKHHTAFSPGLQEFIEALAYLEFLNNRRLITMDEVQSYLSFNVLKNSTSCEAPSDSISQEIEKGAEHEDAPIATEAVQLPLEPMDYLLGIADLTGELMRLCINAVGCSDRQLPFRMLPFMRGMYCGFLSLRPLTKEIGRKTKVLRNSLFKVEKVCYTLKIRGSEIPEHMLVHMISTDTDNNFPMDDNDEQY